MRAQKTREAFGNVCYSLLRERRPEQKPVMTHHHLHSSPETCHWGFFEARLKPVLTVASGDEVTIDTISGGPEVIPESSRFHVPPELAQVHAKNERMLS